ncbi:DDE-type integrase/transposase/recombinase [Ferrovum myxofaciens]|uniref:DDE-type integrase/transposase/recombinase n=1 Tax=Ferrovum myxofaciens TaxID=416213 RepID=UPI003EC04EBC
MPIPNETSARDRWSRLRLLIIGQLLAAPPPRGELKSRLLDLSRQTWRHPIHGGEIRFGVSTLERWLARARQSPDPAAFLATVPRLDAGSVRVISEPLAQAIRTQYADRPKWNIQLHYDNLRLVFGANEFPSYATVLRFFRAQGLWRVRDPRGGPQRTAVPDGTREVRSFEATHVGALFHLDGHQGSLKVLNRQGEWITPIALGVIDDHSRLICHLQWYAHENTECLVHCVSQALQRRGSPRTIYSDNGSAMISGEFTAGLHHLGILALNTRPRSAWMNGKQETLWNRVESRLMAMLDAIPNLTLAQLNEASFAWVEHEYQVSPHRELNGATPMQRFIASPSVLRECPDSETLRRHFRIEVTRKQRQSDGTVSLDGRRFEIPQAFGHLRGLTLRYARWDRNQADIVDSRSGVIQATIYPLDKTRHGDGRRRQIIQPTPDTLLKSAQSAATPSDPQAPLMRHLLAQFAATGLPPAYLELDDASPAQETHP